MKVYITKYALTKGILEKEVEVSPISEKMVVERKNGGNICYHKPFWYENKDDAAKHANELRLKKVKLLEKEISKLDGLFFY